MRATLRAVTCALLLLTPLPQDTSAQPPPPGVDAALDAARAVRGASLEVEVVTFENGAEIFERFGHNAIIVTDRLTGDSRAYNWGVFDFAQPNFLTRFMTGDTRYWLAVYPTQAMIDAYVAMDRTTRRQRLALTPVQAAALAEYVEWNALDEHRFYRYDYFLDNCSTRVRDAIDRALGGALRTAFIDAPIPSTTWRRETRRITDGSWPVYVGIQYGLGRAGDRPLSKWDESFIPMRLADHLRSVDIASEQGAAQSLVMHDTVTYVAQRAPLPAEAPNRDVLAFALGLFGASGIFLLGWRRRAGDAWARLTLKGVTMLWWLLGGLLGTASVLLATVTKHAPYMEWNLSLLQLHPLLLVGALLTPWAGGTGRAALWWDRVALCTGGVALIGMVLQTTVLPQDSTMIVAVTLPVHLAIVASLARPQSLRPARV